MIPLAIGASISLMTLIATAIIWRPGATPTESTETPTRREATGAWRRWIVATTIIVLATLLVAWCLGTWSSGGAGKLTENKAIGSGLTSMKVTLYPYKVPIVLVTALTILTFVWYRTGQRNSTTTDSQATTTRPEKFKAPLANGPTRRPDATWIAVLFLGCVIGFPLLGYLQEGWSAHKEWQTGVERDWSEKAIRVYAKSAGREIDWSKVDQIEIPAHRYWSLFFDQGAKQGRYAIWSALQKRAYTFDRNDGLHPGIPEDERRIKVVSLERDNLNLLLIYGQRPDGNPRLQKK